LPYNYIARYLYGCHCETKVAYLNLWQGRIPKSPNAKSKHAKYKIVAVTQNDKQIKEITNKRNTSIYIYIYI